jgi:hypothetical protein
MFTGIICNQPTNKHLQTLNLQSKQATHPQFALLLSDLRSRTCELFAMDVSLSKAPEEIVASFQCDNDKTKFLDHVLEFAPLRTTTDSSLEQRIGLTDW